MPLSMSGSATELDGFDCGVLNTSDEASTDVALDLEVYLSDYVKIRRMAHDRCCSELSVLCETLVNGVRNLATRQEQ